MLARNTELDYVFHTPTCMEFPTCRRKPDMQRLGLRFCTGLNKDAELQPAELWAQFDLELHFHVAENSPLYVTE